MSTARRQHCIFITRQTACCPIFPYTIFGYIHELPTCLPGTLTLSRHWSMIVLMSTRHFAPLTYRPIGRFAPYAAPLNKYRLSSLSRWSFMTCRWINDSGKWCLSHCGTNITTEQYYEANNEEITLSWMCNDQTFSGADASPPDAESTRLSSDFRSVSKSIRRLMCLPFLPTDDITQMFTSIIAMAACVTQCLLYFANYLTTYSRIRSI